MENKYLYGNQCESDNAFTKKARLLQSMYRVEIGEEEGVGPTRASKHKYGNMISGGDVSGKNFLMKETFEYAKERVEKEKKGKGEKGGKGGKRGGKKETEGKKGEKLR